jgi:type VI protein secretion system component VasK
MSAAAILVAGNRQLTGKTRVLLLFVVVVAAIVAAVPLIAVHDNPYAMRGYAREVFSAVIGGLVVFFAGLYGMLRRRQLRFEPARATLADVRSFLGDEKVETRRCASSSASPSRSCAARRPGRRATTTHDCAARATG